MYFKIVYEFYYCKHSFKSHVDIVYNLDMRLRDHDSKGCGLYKSQFKHGHLSESDDVRTKDRFDDSNSWI